MLQPCRTMLALSIAAWKIVHVEQVVGRKHYQLERRRTCFIAAETFISRNDFFPPLKFPNTGRVNISVPRVVNA